MPCHGGLSRRRYSIPILIKGGSTSEGSQFGDHCDLPGLYSQQEFYHLHYDFDGWSSPNKSYTLSISQAQSSVKKLKLSSHTNPLPQTKKTVRLYIFQKRIGCFNHRVVTLAGYTLTRDMVVMRGSLRLNYHRPLVIIVMTIVGGIPEGRCMLWHHSPNSLAKSLGTRLLGVSTWTLECTP